jgi:dephospho-CoA kinase
MTTAKPVIGMIGGIGSGKSLVADAFARHGAYVISGDRLGHEALRQPEVRDRVAAHFGRGVVDAQGEIDRRRLGAVVFADVGQLRVLEGMVFPSIERQLQEEIAAARADAAVRLVVFDAAVLLEAGWDRWCDAVVYVHAPRAERLARLARQRGWGAKEVEAREDAQMSLTEKVTRADFVVDNSGPPERLEGQVADLLRVWDNATCLRAGGAAGRA